MIHFLAYLIIYFLLALALELLRDLFDPHGVNRRYGAIRRRLWNDSAFDCRSLVFSVDIRQGRRPSRSRSQQIRSAKTA